MNQRWTVVTEDSYLMEEFLNAAPVEIAEGAYFTGGMSHIDGMKAVMQRRRDCCEAEIARSPELAEACVAGAVRAYTGWYDFSHTAPDWENIYSLGLSGLLGRLEEAFDRPNLTERQTAYYEAGIRVWRAALRYIERMATQAEQMGKVSMAQGLRALTVRPPETFYEAMQLTFLFYDLQQHVERTVLRTLGHLDELYLPYFERDLSEGRLTEEQAERMVDEFLLEWDSRKVQANIPFSMGGVTKDGVPRLNRLSYLLLRRHVALRCPNVKLHILWDENLPRDFLQIAMDGIRQGSNSIVFMNDARVKESLTKYGMDRRDVEQYEVVGCYEPCAKGEIPCSGNGRVNLTMALEATLFGGTLLWENTSVGRSFGESFLNFDAFWEAVSEQIRFFCRGCMAMVNAKEAQYPRMHSAPFFSSAYDVCVEQGGDVYCDSVAKYNNSSINLIGLATVTDALLAIRKLVWEDGTLTLDELRKLLRSNWEGQEQLRQKILKTFPKYGIGNRDADMLAQKILSVASEEINGKPNVKGGFYRLGGISIDWRFSLGKRAAASADGRMAGETVSKNLCASLGADREGATAQILSVASLDGNDMPNGSVLDLSLHSSAVKGADGLVALMATLDTFMRLGGMAIQYNVLDVATLREAQRDPSLYPNLQVRLCGWNVLFSTLSKEEQDEFIQQAEVGA